MKTCLFALMLFGLAHTAHADPCNAWNGYPEQCSDDPECTWEDPSCVDTSGDTDSNCWMFNDEGSCSNWSNCEWTPGYCVTGNSSDAKKAEAQKLRLQQLLHPSQTKAHRACSLGGDPCNSDFECCSDICSPSKPGGASYGTCS